MAGLSDATVTMPVERPERPAAERCPGMTGPGPGARVTSGQHGTVGQRLRSESHPEARPVIIDSEKSTQRHSVQPH